MNHFFTQILAGFLATVASSVAFAQTPTGDAMSVTADNFIRAETDRTFAGIEKQGGFSKFLHFRELSSIDNHTLSAPTATHFIRWCVRPQRRTGDNLPARCGQSLHNDDRDRRRSLRVHGRLWDRRPHSHQRGDRHALRPGGNPHPGRSEIKAPCSLWVHLD